MWRYRKSSLKNKATNTPIDEQKEEKEEEKDSENAEAKATLRSRKVTEESTLPLVHQKISVVAILLLIQCAVFGYYLGCGKLYIVAISGFVVDYYVSAQHFTSEFIGHLLNFLVSFIADSFIGKYYLCVVLCVSLIFYSLVLLLFAATQFVTAPMVTWSTHAWTVMFRAFESVWIAYVLEQVKIPEESEKVWRYVNYFYLCRLLGRSLSSIVFILHFQVDASKNDQYEQTIAQIYASESVILAIISSILIVSVKNKSIRQPVYFGIGYKLVDCFVYCLLKKVKQRKEKKDLPKSSEQNVYWLDLGANRYHKEVVDSCKKIVNVAFLFFPVIYERIIYGLLLQLWQYQIDHAHNFPDLPLPIIIIHDHFRLLAFIISNYFIIPLLRKCFIVTDIQLICTGFFLLGLSLLSSTLLQFPIENVARVFPTNGYSQIRFFNAHNSSIQLKSHWTGNFSLSPKAMYAIVHIPYKFPMVDKLVYHNNIEGIHGETTISGGNGVAVSYIVTKEGILNASEPDPIVQSTNPQQVNCYLINSINNSDIFEVELFYAGNKTKYIALPGWKTISNFSVFIGKAKIIFNLTNSSSHQWDYKKTSNQSKHFSFSAGAVYAFFLHDSIKPEIRIFTVIKPDPLNRIPIYISALIAAIGEVNAGVALTRFLYLRSPYYLRASLYSYKALTSSLGIGSFMLVQTFRTISLDLLSMSIWTTVYFVCYLIFIYCLVRSQNNKQ